MSYYWVVIRPKCPCYFQEKNSFDFTEHWNKQITRDIDLYFIHWTEFKAKVVVYIVLACTVFGFLQGWEWAGIWKSTSKFPSFDLFHQLQRLLYQKTQKRWKQNLSKINIWLVTSGFIVLMSVISQPIISFGSLCFFGYGSKRSKTDVSIYLITKWSWSIDYTFLVLFFGWLVINLQFHA